MGEDKMQINSGHKVSNFYFKKETTLLKSSLCLYFKFSCIKKKETDSQLILALMAIRV